MAKRKKRHILSSKLSLKFGNTGKKDQLSRLVDEYLRVTSFFIHLIWKEDHVRSLLSKQLTSQAKTWLSARMVQAAGKQASSIVRGTKEKQRKRLWKIEDFTKRGMFKKARKLQSIYDKVTVSEPILKNIECELDPRFVKTDFENSTSFDGWVTLTSLGNKLKLVLPVKKTKHFNSLQERGTRLSGVRLSKTKVTFNFELPEITKEPTGQVLGIDVGKKTAISCSNGFISQADIHGHTLNNIIDSLSQKVRGSKSFSRKQKHRTNYINWTINQLDLSRVSQINIERIRNLRKGKRVTRKLSGWTYTEIFGKLKSRCLSLGVQVQEVSPTYTSQRCSVCGWVRKDNRKGKLFKCTHCGHTDDADLNASLNLSLNLPAISKEERLRSPNRKGFFWKILDQQHIVADTLKG